MDRQSSARHPSPAGVDGEDGKQSRGPAHRPGGRKVIATPFMQ